MNPNRFDTLSKLFAIRHSRRAAVAGSLGFAGAALTGRALAQDGTPAAATPAADLNDPHPGADNASAKTEFLFVQPFDAGTWAPKDGEDGVFILTLTGTAAQTIYFSDRPERVVGLTPMQDFIDGLGFTPDNPPNAALVAQSGDDGQDVLVIELLNPTYSADASTLTYDARVLADYDEPGLAHLARQQSDYELSETFGAGSLFIDDGCTHESGQCYQTINNEQVIVGSIDIDTCWAGNDVVPCLPCDPDGTDKQYGKACAEAYPDTCNYYTNGVDGWDCFVTGDHMND